MAAEDYFDPCAQDDRPSTNVECRNCGKAGLHWEETDTGKWALYNENYERHKCDPKRLAKNVANDFEELT